MRYLSGTPVEIVPTDFSKQNSSVVENVAYNNTYDFIEFTNAYGDLS
jgi:hypothetical protein